MTLSRVAMIAGTLASGWIVDNRGPRLTLLLALILSALGLWGLPLLSSALSIAFFVMLAQFGNAMYPSSVRLLLIQLVKRETSQREALGWVRMVNNLGQVISFGAGTLIGGWGLIPLFWLDALTGLLSAGYAKSTLPKEPFPTQSQRPGLRLFQKDSEFWKTLRSQKERLLTVLGLGFLGLGFSFFYDLFMITASAKLSLSLGSEGVRVFSIVMLVNTLICALLAVKAAQHFTAPEKVIPAALILGFLGNWIAFAASPFSSASFIFFGILLLTAAELGFFATSTFALLKWIPSSPFQGRIHSLLVLLQVLGRLTAASVAFPILVHGSVSSVRFLLLGALIPVTLLSVWVYPRVKRGFEE